jgi:hypothetical protein
MKKVLHAQNILRENAPPTACGHGAAPQEPGQARRTVCLAWSACLVRHLRHDQAHPFTAGPEGRCCNAALELARIYFPQ